MVLVLPVRCLPKAILHLLHARGAGSCEFPVGGAGHVLGNGLWGTALMAVVWRGPAADSLACQLCAVAVVLWIYAAQRLLVHS